MPGPWRSHPRQHPDHNRARTTPHRQNGAQDRPTQGPTTAPVELRERVEPYANPMSADAILRWTGAGLDSAGGESEDGDIVVADSWLVTEGTALAISLHRERFLATAGESSESAGAFWDAALAALPRTGDWFPRVEVRRIHGRDEMFLRMRTAPTRSLSTTLVTHQGDDPRQQPRIKGPSLTRLETLRSGARSSGADDVVIVDPLGHLVETASS